MVRCWVWSLLDHSAVALGRWTMPEMGCRGCHSRLERLLGARVHRCPAGRAEQDALAACPALREFALSEDGAGAAVALTPLRLESGDWPASPGLRGRSWQALLWRGRRCLKRQAGTGIQWRGPGPSDACCGAKLNQGASPCGNAPFRPLEGR